MPFQHPRKTCWAAAAFVLASLLGACARLPTPPPSPNLLPPPPIISVDAWGGSRLPAPAAPQHIQHITLHHQGETWRAGADVAAYLRRLQQWSRLTKRWADIPYHYVIAPDGQIYAARDPAMPGDTNTEYKPEGHALVMVMGNFEEAQPSAAALRATVELMAWLAQSNGLTADTIASHKDYSTQTVCPGKNLYAYLENGWLRRAVAARMAGRALPAP
ncbi:hypothetical protein BH11PSE10_BH11PSE10_01480 [soil metagenome]